MLTVHATTKPRYEENRSDTQQGASNSACDRILWREQRRRLTGSEGAAPNPEQEPEEFDEGHFVSSKG